MVQLAHRSLLLGEDGGIVAGTAVELLEEEFPVLQSQTEHTVLGGREEGLEAVAQRFGELDGQLDGVAVGDGGPQGLVLGVGREVKGGGLSLDGGLEVGGDGVGLALMSDLTGADLATRQHGGGVAHGIPQLVVLKDTHLHEEAVLGGVVHAHRGVGDVDAVGDGGGVGGGGSIGA